MALTGCELEIYELEVALEQKLKADRVIFQHSGVLKGPIRPFKPGQRVLVLNNVHNAEGDIAKGEIIASILDCAVVYVLEIENKDMLSKISHQYHETPGRAPETVIIHKSYLLSANDDNTVSPDIPYYTPIDDMKRPDKFNYGNRGDQTDSEWCKSRKSMLKKVLAFEKRVSLHDYEIRTRPRSRSRSRSPSAVVVSPVVQSPVERRSPSSARGERKRVTFKGGSRSKRCKRRRMTRRVKRKH